MLQADPKIAERVKKMFETVDAEVDCVLKGHLLIEECLDAILAVSVYQPEFLESAKLTFFHKYSLARALCFSESKNRVWDLISAFSKLRNALAHGLDTPQRTTRTAEMLNLYNELQREDSSGTDDAAQPQHVQIAFAAGFCVGFLQAFEADNRYFGAIVRGMRTGGE